MDELSPGRSCVSAGRSSWPFGRRRAANALARPACLSTR